jgi:tetratricopeptide (TPR) repeat protein
MSRVAASLLLLLLGAGAVVRAADENEGDPELAGRLARLVAEEKWSEALRTADETLAHTPDSLLAWQYRAYALHRLGRSEDAKSAYEKTLELDPKNWWACINLAELLASRGKVKAALPVAERAVALMPRSVDVRTRVSRIHREAGDYETALAEAVDALSAGVDPKWCHAELGYLYWVLGNTEKSRDHWLLAKKEGADREKCLHGLRLVEWDRPRGSTRVREEVSRRRIGYGDEWTFDVEGVTVYTRVGPRLPREIEKLIGELRKEQAAILGLRTDETWTVHLHLSRTLEEHERHRQARYPDGYSGKAFVVPRWNGRRGFPRGPGPRHELDVYIAWALPGLEKSLAHELAHALVRVRIPRASWPPVWLDEGIATFLELTPDERGRLGIGRVRGDLLRTLRAAREAGTLLPLASLLAAERPAFTGRLARVRYARSWALVHYLLEGDLSGSKRRWNEYLDRWNSRGRPAPGEFLKAVYGLDLPELEKRLAEHIAELGG